MTINSAATEILQEIKDIEGLEINFSESIVDIYWVNLRVMVEPKNFQKAIRAIKVLISLEASFE